VDVEQPTRTRTIVQSGQRAPIWEVGWRAISAINPGQRRIRTEPSSGGRYPASPPQKRRLLKIRAPPGDERLFARRHAAAEVVEPVRLKALLGTVMLHDPQGTLAKSAKPMV